MITEYFDTSITIDALDISKVDKLLTRFESELHSDRSSSPIAAYARTLRGLRKEVQSVQTNKDEIEFGHTFKERLLSLAKELQLPDDHFSIDVSGEPLLVREERGEHLISPTHFENGAYFSHPHADHQLDWRADELPRIKIGQYVRFGRNASVNAGGDVTIGNGAWLSPGSQLLRQDHDPYGRPSVGSRTVAMTKLPPITLEEYAWVGRETLIGWGADYLGKASVCATRAFVNTWVGDYSITGDRGRIIQYMPFKAYALEYSDTSLRDVLRITDWSAINTAWLETYRSSPADAQTVAELPADILRKGASVLVIAPSGLNVVSAFKHQKIDIIDYSRKMSPYILQWAQDNGKYDVRFRADLNTRTLPFPTGGDVHYRRTIGYDTVVCCLGIDELSVGFLNEIKRVLRTSGKLIAPTSLVDHISQAGADEHGFSLTPDSDLTLAGEAYTIFARTKS
ncbi:hypothetical protein FS827_22245 [Agrobacterium vitis]|uniref:hypothetical protein n=1 Tax=Allorhizobium ampelinum TaxID=3025782 RepID=UPI001F3937E3|nr:hypothetical protein [Allorhizobium ampelinum]MCF1464029.1 hypothetical protein [Allorhizobium ampelinum]